MSNLRHLLLPLIRCVLEICIYADYYPLIFICSQGALVEAVSEGWWILLDEVNLASAETLQCLSAVLESHNESLFFMEKP